MRFWAQKLLAAPPRRGVVEAAMIPLCSTALVVSKHTGDNDAISKWTTGQKRVMNSLLEFLSLGEHIRHMVDAGRDLLYTRHPCTSVRGCDHDSNGLTVPMQQPPDISLLPTHSHS